MNSTVVEVTSTVLSSATAALPSTSDAPQHHVRHQNAVVAFIIGFAIVTLASVLNAAGLNLTKLDHVRTSAIPKASRRKDWLRPLWLLGMLLYILSQLIGSTLALEYLRAEYVAPLGSTSLIFNFLFARFLVGTPVTSTDIYGTVIVIAGVIGIVAFGSINSGLDQDTSVSRLTYLWRRPGWLGFFFLVAFALLFLYMFVSTLDAVLTARSDLSAAPFGARRRGPVPATPFGRVKAHWDSCNGYIAERLESWTAAKDDQLIAWTLGIGWSCCGGGLAGGTLVFAKAAVKLISGSLSHENEGNQLGHASAIFTLLLTAVTAVAQIVCLNRGLKAYDSTLCVPVFYGVYTAAGFLDALVFNDAVDAYKPWTLFAIFCAIAVLVAGVVTLTHKKPEHTPGKKVGAVPARRAADRKASTGGDEDEEAHALHPVDLEAGGGPSTPAPAWTLGDDEDDEDDAPRSPMLPRMERSGGEEGRGLMADGEDEYRAPRQSSRPGHERTRSHTRADSQESDATLAARATDEADDFGEWKDGTSGSGEHSA